MVLPKALRLLQMNTAPHAVLRTYRRTLPAGTTGRGLEILLSGGEEARTHELPSASLIVVTQKGQDSTSPLSLDSGTAGDRCHWPPALALAQVRV